MKYLAILLLLGGCATPHSYTRVIEYGGGGVITPFTGEVGGCSVYESQDKVIAKISYNGKACSVEVNK